MENGSIKIPETSLRVGTYRLIQINRMLPYLGIGAKSYDADNLNKIIVKSLSPKAMKKYVGDGGDDLDDINNILDLMSLIDSKLSLKREVAALEQQQNKMKSKNQQSKDKGKSTNGELRGERKMPCRKHDGEHDWRDCPNNKNRRPQSESKKEKEKSQKKDLHSTKGSNVTTKKTPMVRIDEKKEDKKNRYKDLDYSSDDGLAMMVQASNNKQVNGITIVEVPGKEGTCHAITILIDNGFTGYAMMSYSFAKKLGYEFQHGKGESYRTTTGNMKTMFSVKVTDIRLPALSRHRTFTATFEVAPPESGDFGYGIIMGIGMMDELGIDQSRTDKMITWGHDIEVPMVPIGYWTDACIQSICKANNKKEHAESNSKNLETKEENSTIKSKYATISEADLFLTANKPNEASFKKAVYETPDLLEVAKRDGMQLTPAQQAMLLNILVKNQDVFKGGGGYYNGEPVGIKLKDDAIPYRAKPYPIPLKNRKVLEHEVARQCSVGCLGRLTPEEFEKREWAFPAFGVSKKNDTIRFVIDFRRINANLLRREFPLWTTEEILTSIKGFLYATSIDLNMGYPSIPLNDKARKILTIVLPFGAYECLTLPMGVMPASDLFQARMVHIFAGMDKRRPFPYIDDILHFKGDTFEQHLSILEKILGLIGKNGLQVSVEKSRFCQESVEYLRFQLNRTGYEPLPSRVSAILRINPPKDVRGVRGFLGVLNFIKNHIPRRAEICEPITRLTKKDVKFIWGEEQQRAFDKLKAVVSEAILLTYPNPNRPFDIYPDASSTYAMGAVLAQD
jgi:hypothetical protein